jgi:hypothetical protein
MRFLPSQSNIDFLKERFEEVDFALYRSDDDEHFISCFVARFRDDLACENVWKQINNEIAMNFQAKLENDLAAWNIYLSLVTPSPVDRDLKYKIENDRFALRKIVFSTFEAEIEADAHVKVDTSEGIGGSIKTGVDDDASILSFLETAIFGKDLELYTKTVESFGGSGDSLIRAYLSKVPQLPLDGKEKSAQLRKQHIEELITLLLKS